MNGTEVYKVIEEIAATGSAVAKRAIIEKHKDDELFKKVLDYALNPFKKYGIASTTMPVIPHHTGGWAGISLAHLDTPQIWKMLDDMISGTLSGKAAIDSVTVTFGELCQDEAELLRRIILKDLRCGVTAKTVNKVIPGHIPHFECMLAQKFEEKRIKRWPQILEPKIDGFRVLAFVDWSKDEVKFFSRAGHEYTVFDHLKRPILDTFTKALVGSKEEAYLFETMPFGGSNHRVVLDGEMVSGDFAKTSSELRKKDTPALDAKFKVFDVAPYSLFQSDEKEDKESCTYEQRREILRAYLTTDESQPVHMLSGYMVNSFKEIKQYYLNFRDAGLEGAVVKNPKARYQRKRTYDWLKMKNEETFDLTVVGYYLGEPGTKYEKLLGGLICNFMGVRVDVGGGFSDEQRKTFLDAMLRDEGRRDTEEEPEYELLYTVVEVEAHEVTPDGSLRHPRFVRLRKGDKPAEDEGDDE